jgi:hypothetical protein
VMRSRSPASTRRRRLAVLLRSSRCGTSVAIRLQRRAPDAAPWHRGRLRRRQERGGHGELPSMRPGSSVARTRSCACARRTPWEQAGRSLGARSRAWRRPRAGPTKSRVRRLWSPGPPVLEPADLVVADDRGRPDRAVGDGIATWRRPGPVSSPGPRCRCRLREPLPAPEPWPRAALPVAESTGSRWRLLSLAPTPGPAARRRPAWWRSFWRTSTAGCASSIPATMESC